MVSEFLEKKPTISWRSGRMIAIKSAQQSKTITMTVRMPFWARSYFPAPTFCPTNDVTAMESDWIASQAKLSILLPTL